jgi:hypothetical protein
MESESIQRKASEADKPEHDYIETAGPGISPGEKAADEKNIRLPGQKKELKEADEYANLGYSYPTWKKWCVPSLYRPGIGDCTHHSLSPANIALLIG